MGSTSPSPATSSDSGNLLRLSATFYFLYLETKKFAYGNPFVEKVEGLMHFFEKKYAIRDSAILNKLWDLAHLTKN